MYDNDMIFSTEGTGTLHELAVETVQHITVAALLGLDVEVKVSDPAALKLVQDLIDSAVEHDVIEGDQVTVTLMEV
ncbi:hypothetical protein [Telmatospirillum sp. J64-1]|uniref:hypothetical protein n=1 Tax=Telmatospirillum sp. J64-1 TaxID=2502183 RepID=UPI00115C66D4|nr:hypothetical protein [Telmatospirillum sp. J64-1]